MSGPTGSESIPAKTRESAMGMTVLDGDGFPLHYLTSNCIEKYRSIKVGACDGGAARVSEPGNVGPDQLHCLQ